MRLIPHMMQKLASERCWWPQSAQNFARGAAAGAAALPLNPLLLPSPALLEKAAAAGAAASNSGSSLSMANVLTDSVEGATVGGGAVAVREM